MWLIGIVAFGLASVGVSVGAARRYQLRGLAVLATALFVVRMLLAVANLSVGPLPGLEADSVALLMHAERVGDQLISGGGFYPWTHRYSYANVLAPLALIASGDNLALLVAAFHAFIWTLVLCDLAWVGRRMGAATGPLLLVIAIAGLHPPSLLYSAGGLREAPLILCLVGYLRGVLATEPGREWRSPRVWACILAGSYLHAGLMMLVPLTLACPAIRGVRGNRVLFAVRVLVSVSLVAVVLGLAAGSAGRLQAVPKFARYFNEEGTIAPELVRDRQIVRSRGEGAYRLHYPQTGLPLANLLLSVPEAVMRLEFSPYPWELALSGRSLFKALDLILQAAMLWLAARACIRRGVRKRVRMAAVLFLVLAGAFGLAAANDGIALRHRSKLFCIACVVAAVELTARAERRALGRKPVRRAGRPRPPAPVAFAPARPAAHR